MLSAAATIKNKENDKPGADEELAGFVYSEAQLHKLAQDIYNAEIDEDNLPEDLYFAIADYLKKGLYEGAGGTIADFEDNPLELLTELRKNIYRFSAAKTYTQVSDMYDALKQLTDNLAEGEKRVPFNVWYDKATEIFDNYNKNYARTEYNTVVSSGQNGFKWLQIQDDKEALPYIQLSVVEDANTSDICAPLDGICLPVDDPFWDEFYPPNHFNCRTTAIQVADEGRVSTKEQVGEARAHADNDIPDEFRNNCGKTGEAFTGNHGYFQYARQAPGFDNNFGLEIPEEDQ